MAPRLGPEDIGAEPARRAVPPGTPLIRPKRAGKPRIDAPVRGERIMCRWPFVSYPTTGIRHRADTIGARPRASARRRADRDQAFTISRGSLMGLSDFIRRPRACVTCPCHFRPINRRRRVHGAGASPLKWECFHRLYQTFLEDRGTFRIGNTRCRRRMVSFRGKLCSSIHQLNCTISHLMRTQRGHGIDQDFEFDPHIRRRRRAYPSPRASSGGPFAVCADVGIPPVCSRPRADNTTHRTSSHPLPHSLEPQSRPFDSLSAAA